MRGNSALETKRPVWEDCGGVAFRPSSKENRKDILSHIDVQQPKGHFVRAFITQLRLGFVAGSPKVGQVVRPRTDRLYRAKYWRDVRSSGKASRESIRKWAVSHPIAQGYILGVDRPRQDSRNDHRYSVLPVL